MATQQQTIDYLLDQLAHLGVSSRKMFGEYALYCEGKVVALVCDDRLYLKITDQGSIFLDGRCGTGPAYPGAKPSFVIEEDLWDDQDWMIELFSITTAHVPEPKPKKKKA